MIDKYIHVFIIVIIGLVLCLCFNCSAEVDMEVLKLTESDGDQQAISCSGAKYGRGLYQISEVMLKDYNYYNKCNIKPYELFNVEINTNVCHWAIECRIPQLLRHYDCTVSDESILHAYNIGCKAYSRGERNYKYINRYETKGGVV